jgi:antitoxin ParD1/3/4
MDMNQNLAITLGPHFEKFVQEKINSGRYATESEVFRAALRLLELDEQKLLILQKALQEGEDSGFVENWDFDSHLKSLQDKNK